MRYKLTIQYDGGGYHGWQRQKNGITVQEAMETDSATFDDDGEEIIGEYDEAGGLDSPALPDGVSSDAQEAPQNAPETARAETIPPSAENAPEAQEIASPSNPDDEQAAIESLFANGGL